MNASTRHSLKRLMRAAWELARLGAQRFGGSSRLYFSCALRLVWADSRNGGPKARPASYWAAGLGNTYALPGVLLPQQVRRGQYRLPGISD